MAVKTSFVLSGCLLVCLTWSTAFSLSVPLDICTLSAESGSCEAAITRWFYNTSTELCETFIYGGCDGNENNFETQEACVGACECSRQPQHGSCDGNELRWYYNDASRKCERFIYGGCGGNANSFETRTACERRCGTSGCFENPNARKCRKLKRRWKYSVKRNGQGKCTRFRWKGCRSENVFSNKRQCQAQCDKDLCPVLNCDLNCPFGYTTDVNGCPECCCALTSCSTDADCCSGYACNSDFSVCLERTPEVCPAEKPFNEFCQSPSCDRNCTTKDDLIPCTLETSARCCCPADKPILAADGETCLSRDQCPPGGGSCEANQVYGGCCTPAACQRTCENPQGAPGIFCPAVCVSGCCCPPGLLLAEDRMTCVRGRDCQTSLCAAVSCEVGSNCNPDTGLCEQNPQPLA